MWLNVLPAYNTQSGMDLVRQMLPAAVAVLRQTCKLNLSSTPQSYYAESKKVSQKIYPVMAVTAHTL